MSSLSFILCRMRVLLMSSVSSGTKYKGFPCSDSATSFTAVLTFQQGETSVTCNQDDQQQQSNWSPNSPFRHTSFSQTNHQIPHYQVCTTKEHHLDALIRQFVLN